MSVLIKDMEMPKKCGECAIYVCYRTWNNDPGDEFCGMTKENVSYKTKPDWCPLSEEPERKTGKWNFIGDNMFECTSCGVAYTTRQLNGLRNRDTDPYAPKFCPNCGSDNRIKHTDTSPYDNHDPMPKSYKERKNETDNSNQTD